MAKTKPIALRLDEERIEKINIMVKEKGYNSVTELVKEAIDEKLNPNGLYVEFPEKDSQYLDKLVDDGDYNNRKEAVEDTVRLRRRKAEAV